MGLVQIRHPSSSWGNVLGNKEKPVASTPPQHGRDFVVGEMLKHLSKKPDVSQRRILGNYVATYEAHSVGAVRRHVLLDDVAYHVDPDVLDVVAGDESTD